MGHSLEHECVCLHAFETGCEPRAGPARWIGYYNIGRPHSTLARHTPDQMYGIARVERLVA